MKKFAYIIPVVLFMLVATPRIFALQISGCEDSPENPTAVLAVLGAAGMGISHMWRRFRARSK